MEVNLKNQKNIFLLTDTIECYKERDLTLRSGEFSISGLTTCDTKKESEITGLPINKCYKSDCGEC